MLCSAVSTVLVLVYVLGWVGVVVLCSAVSTVLVLLYVLGWVGVVVLCSAVSTVLVLVYVPVYRRALICTGYMYWVLVGVGLLGWGL